MAWLWRNIIAPTLVASLVASLLTPLAWAEQRRRRQRTGFIEVVSLTEGAEVFVDGESVGDVPLPEKIRVPVGEHTVKVSKRGHTQHLEVVRVKRRQTTTVEADLLALSGILRVEADVEEARVYVDEDYVGNCPLEHEVDPGERQVRVTMAGYHDHEETVEVIAGEEASISVELEALPEPAVPPRERRWYEQWWVWTIIGTVVVAAGIAIPVALTREGDPCEEHADWPSCDHSTVIQFHVGQ